MVDFTLFIREMQALIIKQYFGKPNAMAEIALYCKMIKDTIDILDKLEAKTGYPVATLALLAGISKPPSITSKDFESLLKAIFSARNFNPTTDGLQKVYSYIFNNKATVTDNMNGTFTIDVDPSINKPLITYFQNHENRLPAPIGVKPLLQSQKLADFFGFDDNPNSKGFGDKRPNTPIGGTFVEKI